MFDEVMETLNVELDRLRGVPTAATTIRLRIDCAAGFGCVVVPSDEPRRALIWTCRWVASSAGQHIQMPDEISESLANELRRIQSEHATHTGEPLDGICYRFDISARVIELGVFV